MNKVNTIASRYILVLSFLLILYTGNAAAQSMAVCFTRNNPSVSQSTNNNVLACFTPDYINMSVTLNNFGSGNTIIIDHSSSAVNFDYSGLPPGYFSAPSDINGTLTFTATNTYSGSFNIAIEFTGCCNMNSVNQLDCNSASLCSVVNGGGHNGLVAIHWTDNSGIYPPSVGACTGPNDITNDVYDGLGTFLTTVSHSLIDFNNQYAITFPDAKVKPYYLKNDVGHRYYSISAASGAADYFTLQIQPEGDINITSIDAVDPNSGVPIKNIYPGTGNVSLQSLIFNSNNIGAAYATVGNTNHASSLYGYLLNVDANNYDYIVLMETFTVTKMQNCDVFTPATSTYSLQKSCDEGATSCCSTAPVNLTVSCLQPTINLTTTVSASNTFDMCDYPNGGGTDITITITNNTDETGAAPGSGAIQLSDIAIPFNFQYFRFGGQYPTVPDLTTQLNNGPINSVPYNNVASRYNYYLNSNTYATAFYIGNYYYEDPTNTPISIPANGQGSVVIVIKNVRMIAPATSVADLPAVTLTPNPAYSVFYNPEGVNLLTYTENCDAGTNNTQTSPFVPNSPNQYSYLSIKGTSSEQNITNAITDHSLFTFNYNPTYTSGSLSDPLVFSYFNSMSAAFPSNLTTVSSPLYYVDIAMPTGLYIGTAMSGQQYITIKNQSSGNSKSFDITNPAQVTVVLPGTDGLTHYVVYYGSYSGLTTAGANVQVSFLVGLDCSGTGANLSATATFYVDYTCSTSANIYRRNLGSKDINIFGHCGGNCNSLVSTSNLSLLRNTFGWLSPSSDLTQPSDIPNPQATCVLDRVYQYDHVTLTSTLGSFDATQVTGLSNFGFQLAYVWDESTTFNSGIKYQIFEPNQDCSTANGSAGTFTFTKTSGNANAPTSFTVFIPPVLLQPPYVELDQNSTNVTINSVPYPNVFNIRFMIPASGVIPGYTPTVINPQGYTDPDQDFYYIMSQYPAAYQVDFTADIKINDPNADATVIGNAFSSTYGEIDTKFMEGEFICDGTASTGPLKSDGFNHSCDPYATEIKYLDLFHTYSASNDHSFNNLGFNFANSNANKIDGYELEYFSANGTSTNRGVNNGTGACTKQFIASYYVSGGEAGEPDFPGEYRPFYQWDNVDFTLPSSLTYTTGNLYTLYDYTDHVTCLCGDGTPGPATLSLTGNIQLDGSLQLQCANNQPQFPKASLFQMYLMVLQFTPTCIDYPWEASINSGMMKKYFYTNAFNTSTTACLTPVPPDKEDVIAPPINNIPIPTMDDPYTNVGQLAPYNTEMALYMTPEIGSNGGAANHPDCAHAEVFESNTTSATVPMELNRWISQSSGVADGTSLNNIWFYVDATPATALTVNTGTTAIQAPFTAGGHSVYYLYSLTGPTDFNVQLTLAGNCTSNNVCLTFHYGYACSGDMIGDWSVDGPNANNSCFDNTYTVNVQFNQPNLSMTMANSAVSMGNCDDLQYHVTVNNTGAMTGSTTNFGIFAPEPFTFVSGILMVTTSGGTQPFTWTPAPTSKDLMSINGLIYPGYSWDLSTVLSGVSGVITKYEFYIDLQSDNCNQVTGLSPDLILSCFFSTTDQCGDAIDLFPDNKLFGSVTGLVSPAQHYCCMNLPTLNAAFTTTPACGDLCDGSFTVTVTDVNSVPIDGFTVEWGDVNNPGAGISSVTAASNSNVVTIPSVLCPKDLYNIQISFSGYVGYYSYSYSVGAEPSLSVAETSTGCGPNAGSLLATVTTIPLNNTVLYSWAPTTGAASTLGNLSDGTYYITATDQQTGCQTTGSGTVLHGGLNLSFDAPPLLCSNYTGPVNLTVTGGYAPYLYSWNNAQTTQNLSGVSPGTYSVTVTDNDGCTATSSVDLTATNIATLVQVTPSSSNTCPGVGSVLTANFDNCTWTYSAYLTPLIGGQVTATPPEGSTKTFMVTGTDDYGCTSTQNVTVTTYPLTDPPLSVPSLCSGQSGQISVSGGLSYAWYPSTGLSATTGSPITVTDAATTPYILKEVDDNMCTVIKDFTVNVVGPITVLPVVKGYCIGYTGGVALSASGGGDNYTWTPSTFLVPTTGQSVVASPPTTMPYTVTSTVGACTLSQTFTVNVANLSVSAGNDVTTCGTILLSGVSVSGGSGVYTYSWSPGPGGSIDDPTLEYPTVTITQTTPYTLIVTDASGCSGSSTVTVSLGSPPTVNETEADAGCGQMNGSVSVSVIGGSAPFTYTWSPSNADVSSLSNLPAGIYSVTVNDAGGCSGTATATVSNTTVFAVNTSKTDASCGSSNGSITVTPLGGSPAYTYTWSNGSTTSTTSSATLSNQPAGTYNITVTDINGCSGTATATISNASSWSIIPTTTNACGQNANGSINITISGSAQAYTYSWSNAATTQNISGLVAGPYTITVTDASGCTNTSTITITSNGPCPCDLLTVSFTAGAGPNPIQFTSTVGSGGAPVTAYLWTFGDGTTSALANPLHEFAYAGNHKVCLTVMILDSPNHCCDSSCQIICVTTNGFSCENYMPSFYMEVSGDNSVQYTNATWIRPGNSQPSFLWTFDDGGHSNSVTDFTHIFSGGSGTFYTCLTIVDPIDGTQCSNEICQSIADIGGLEALAPIQTTDFMMIDPGQATDYVDISYKNVCSSNARIVIYDGNGDEQFSSSINPDQSDLHIDIKLWPSGFYTAKLFVDNQLLEVKRFSKSY